MRELLWSATQKKAARAAFDLALARELKSIRQHADAMLRESEDDRVVWSLRDYLSERGREIDRKYDFRYSVLMLVFHRLVFEGWLTEDELAGIGTEKVEMIRRVRSNTDKEVSKYEKRINGDTSANTES
jgi:Photoprotection regulator fluorescence recovery protein